MIGADAPRKRLLQRVSSTRPTRSPAARAESSPASILLGILASAPLLAGRAARRSRRLTSTSRCSTFRRAAGRQVAQPLHQIPLPASAEQCPFSAVDNNCIQYQRGMRELALNLTRDGTDGTFYPELGAEWERVNLALCRAIYAGAYGPTAQRSPR